MSSSTINDIIKDYDNLEKSLNEYCIPVIFKSLRGSDTLSEITLCELQVKAVLCKEEAVCERYLETLSLTHLK